jgi:hypothetical protein
MTMEVLEAHKPLKYKIGIAEWKQRAVKKFFLK